MSATPISILVSDFGEREPSWGRLRSCLTTLAQQEGIERAEVVLCEMPSLFGQLPDDLRESVPNLRLIQCDSTDPHARKTCAARQASGSIVAFLDADCLPQAGWLQRITDSFHYYPETAMVHGRIVGENRGWQGQLRRFFLGAEAAEGTSARYTATNNAAFRREVYCEYPFPEASGKQAVRIQTAAMLRAHYVLWREPAMLVLRDRRGVRQVGRAAAEQVLVTR